MRETLKIAIYSGAIPSTTFIENLINSLGSKHTILLFGKERKKTGYSEKNIYCYSIYNSTLRTLVLSIWRTLLLVFVFPKRCSILWRELKTIGGISSKYHWWTRYTPVLLNLPTIFHIQWGKDLEHWIFLKDTLNVKIVLSLRGAHINYSPISNPNLAESYSVNFPKVDGFHAVSRAIALEAQKYGASAERIKVIYSLITERTFDLYSPLKEREKGIYTIISVGRHHWKKGYSTALNACKLLKEANIEFKYTIIAAGHVPEELIFQRHELGLLNEVEFLSSLSQKSVLNKMKKSSVLLLPSLEEGIANVVLEAMAIGVPVVSADCGGMAEIIFSDETGWLVPVLDSQMMSQALKEVHDCSNGKLKEITQNAHEFIKENFMMRLGVDQFKKFYNEVLETKGKLKKESSY